MTNYESYGNPITIPAPAGGCTSGVPFVHGSMFYVPQSTEAATVDVSCIVEGVVSLAAEATDTFSQDLPVYWNTTSGKAEDTDSTLNTLIGVSLAAASGGYVRVRLNGVSLAALTGDLANKIDKVTGLTGYVPKMTAGGGVESSGILAVDVQVDTVPAIAGNLAGLDAAGKLTDSGIAGAGFIASLPAAVAGNVPAFAAGGASVTDSGVLAANLQVLTVPVAGHSVAGLTAAGALEDTTILTANLQVLAVPTAANNVALLDAAGAIIDSTMASANLQVLTVPAAAGNLAQLSVLGALEDSTIDPTAYPVANIDTGAGGAGIPWLADGAGGSSFTAVDSAGIANGAIDPLHVAGVFTVTTMTAGGGFYLILDAEAAATPIDYDLTTNAQLAFSFRILGARAHCTAANAGGTLQLFDAAGGLGNAITGATICAVADTSTRATLDWTQGVVNGATDTVSIAKNAAGDDGMLILECVKA